MNRQAKLEMEKMVTRAKFPYLIEVTYNKNDGTSEILRYANSDEDKTFEGHTFNAGYFTMQLPQKTTSGFTDAKINISAIDHTWIEKIRNTSKRATIRFVAVIEYENGGSESIEPIEDMEFVLTNATSDGTTIQWTMKFDELMEMQMPYEECNDRVCPALV